MSRRRRKPTPRPKDPHAAPSAPMPPDAAILLHDEEKREAYPDLVEPEELEKQRQREQGRKERYMRKLATREDVVTILTLYIDQVLVPLAQRMDELQYRVYTPWWQRLWDRWRSRDAEHGQQPDAGVGGESPEGTGEAGEPGIAGTGGDGVAGGTGGEIHGGDGAADDDSAAGDAGGEHRRVHDGGPGAAAS